MINNVSHLPEHGPIAENGREVLLSLKNVDITFGKGDNAVRAVKNASFDIYKGEMLKGNTLLLAYNAHFDLSFLYYFLLRDGDPLVLKGKDKLDLLTVYKDRRPYPHKLCCAIDAYGLSGRFVNSHRAVDDVIATTAVALEMEQERDDLERYINLFGYNPKYGVEGKKISTVTYKPQPYDPKQPLYL